MELSTLTKPFACALLALALIAVPLALVGQLSAGPPVDTNVIVLNQPSDDDAAGDRAIGAAESNVADASNDANSATQDQTDLTDPADNGIDELTSQLLETLRTLVERVRRQHAQGLTGFVDVVEARDQLLSAEAQLATSHQRRVEIHESIVANLQELESAVEEEYDLRRGGVSLNDVLRARARRLKAAIRLLEVKQSEQ